MHRLRVAVNVVDGREGLGLIHHALLSGAWGLPLFCQCMRIGLWLNMFNYMCIGAKEENIT